jgi:hypothetical protein
LGSRALALCNWKLMQDRISEWLKASEILS